MSLTTIIASWGAGLSTFLAFWKDRPCYYIRYNDFASAGLIDISVENRSDADIIVRGARVLFCQDCKMIFGDPIREIISSQLGRPGRTRSRRRYLHDYVRSYEGCPQPSTLFRGDFLTSAPRSRGSNSAIARPSAASGTGTVHRPVLKVGHLPPRQSLEVLKIPRRSRSRPARREPPSSVSCIESIAGAGRA
jgi:hypothetical protein